MGLQRLVNVGVSNMYYDEKGNILLNYYVEGDAMSGAGKVNIKIELDNVQVSSSNVDASFPGRTPLNTTVGLSSRVPGSTHTIKITGTKAGVVKTASKSNTFPVQSDLDKININFIHKETIPEKILIDTFSFINIGNFGVVRFAIDENVTDSSTKYETNTIQTIPNNDNKRHVINYRYKCGNLVTTKSYTVDHSTSNPDHRVPYNYPNPVLTQVDNNHYEISIHDFTNDGSRYGVTDTSEIKVRVTYNNNYTIFDYADFTGNKLNVELNYSTKITCFIYNTKYFTDRSEDVILKFVYKLPEVKMLKPIISWIYMGTGRPGNKRRKAGIIITSNFDAIKNLNIKEFPNIESDGTLYTIYTKDGSIPNIDNTIEKLTEEKKILDTNNVIYYFRNVFVYNDKKRNPTYSDPLRIVYNISGKGSPFYFDYEKPSLEYPSNICSYLDVIYNNDYNNSKSLESINYILNYFDNRYSLNAKNIYNVAEDDLRRRYAGYYLDVYTDETQAINLKLSDGSNDTDENNRDTFNHYNDYKFAKFDKGSWNFNYFRNGFNRGNTELSETELVRACNYIYYNPSTKQNEVHVITEEDLKKSPLYKSDNRSLIYGKYIVARFIFNNDDDVAHRFKLENITFNIQPY
ncbi:hypothetical protein KNV35_gp89 [uncultured phage cr8_1]|uniref:Uncharacterized protein n=1 Tax=uncultured phage cr8_1 TaxID=2772068 RepID=A0A7M1RX19_9CAUD|nr:hypothetical protein KNV35_gp89 [uncultured phage cr8_1]QOR58846.1 hypothetical protein [uncultured phage cr8_1]